MIKKILNWIRERWIWKTAAYKGQFQKDHKRLFKLKDKMPWNIYSPGMDYGTHFKTYHFIHSILKPLFIQPSLRLLEKFFGNYIKNKVPDQHYNKNLKIFDESFEETMEDWVKFYLNFRDGKTTPRYTKREVEKLVRCHPSCRFFRTMKNIVLTVALWDTAYFEFMNIFMYKIGKNFHKEYKGKPIRHIMYTSPDTFDTTYFMMTKIFEKHRNRLLININLLKEEYKDGRNIKTKEDNSGAARNSETSKKKDEG